MESNRDRDSFCVGEESIRLQLEAARKKKAQAQREKTAKRHASHNAKRRPASSKKKEETEMRQRLRRTKEGEDGDRKNRTKKKHEKYNSKRRIPKSAKKRKKKSKSEVARQKRLREDEDALKFEAMIEDSNVDSPFVSYRGGELHQLVPDPVPITQEEEECDEYATPVEGVSARHDSAANDSPVVPRLAGLRNPGQICYANACIQMCYRDPIFRSAVLELPSSEHELIEILTRNECGHRDSVYSKKALPSWGGISEEPDLRIGRYARCLSKIRDIFVKLDSCQHDMIDSCVVVNAFGVDPLTPQCANEFWENVINYFYDLCGLRSEMCLFVQEEQMGALKNDAVTISDVREMGKGDIQKMLCESIPVDLTMGR